jgi:putative adhesin
VGSRRETFSTAERARLKVRNPAGDVQVRTGDAGETMVELVPLDDSESTREAIEKARVDASGDEITVEVEGRGWSISIGDWGIGRSPKVSVRITCPPGSDLESYTASADLTTAGSLGTVRVHTASGDSTVERVEGDLEVKTASGDLRVEWVQGRAEVNTVSGDVVVETALHGLAINSISGDVAAGEITGDLTVSSVSGDQRIRAAGPGEVALKAVSGDVQVAIRRGLRIRLDVNSVSGSIRSELEVSDAPVKAEGPETNLRVRTVSGDVKIARASAEAIV